MNVRKNMLSVEYFFDLNLFAAKGKGKFFYGQKFSRGESTTTDCVGSIINYLQ